ncbi:MAG: type II secretion system F family protein [Fimbriimonadaceae bacterium]
MATFAYVAVDATGKRKSGVIEAPDQKAAVSRVASEGRFVIEIEAKAEGAATAKREKSETTRRGRTSKADIALFMRRLADLSSAGLPLDRVLAILSEQSESAGLATAAADALDEVKKGIPVSAALARHPRFFPDMYTQTLASGEESGQFPEAAEKLAELLENEVARRSQVVSALIYPGVLTATAIFVVIFLLAFVVPRLSSVFEGLGSDLPLPTKVLLATTDFLTSNGVYLGIGTVVLYIVLRGWMATPAGKLARDATMLRLPGFGKVVTKSVVSRYARVLGTLVQGGVPILRALDLAGLAAGNAVFAHRNVAIQDEVRSGATVANAMRDSGEFPPVLTHMVAIGEETGDLPKMLGRVADSLDFEVEQGLRRLTSLLEPVIVLAMGGFVAFVVLSVMLPIFQAQELVK